MASAARGPICLLQPLAEIVQQVHTQRRAVILEQLRADEMEHAASVPMEQGRQNCSPVHCIWQKTVGQPVHFKVKISHSPCCFLPDLTGYRWGSQSYCGKVKKQRNLGSETLLLYSLNSCCIHYQRKMVCIVLCLMIQKHLHSNTG